MKRGDFSIVDYALAFLVMAMALSLGMLCIAGGTYAVIKIIEAL